jgi:hypothetical protein
MPFFTPISDRGVTLPRVEAGSPHSGAPKKAWLVVYTAPRHEKFVQAQLIAKQIQSFLLSIRPYDVGKTWFGGRSSTRFFRVMSSSGLMRTSGFRYFRLQASYTSWETASHRYPSMIMRCRPFASVLNADRLRPIPFYARARRFALNAVRSREYGDM